MYVLGCLLAAGVTVHALHALTGLGGDELVETWIYDGVLMGAALVCAARALLVRVHRVAWAVLAAGLAAWATGDLYWSLAVEGTPAEDGVTFADAGWLSFYPACYVALGMLVAARVPRLPRSAWIDGFMAAAAAAAVGSALFLPTLLDGVIGAPTWTKVVNLAYPTGDMLLLSIVLGVFTATGWRLDRMWLVLGLGLSLSAVADVVYLQQIARDTYVSGGLLDTLWPASTLLLAAAAWQPGPPMQETERGAGTLAVTSCAALAAIALLAYDHFVRVDHTAMALATVTLVLGTARMLLAFRDNRSMLVASRHEAVTDALTGLGNRRGLLQDLEAALGEGEPVTLVAYDLDGFKAYNDGFGHPAGDALLARLGQKLGASVAGAGSAYRMGGDEFCVLLRDRDAEVFAARARQALTEVGFGFSVAASFGSVRVPAEAVTTSEALQIADRRLYRQKSSRANSPRTQTRDVLMRVLREREPDLHDHLRSVARLASAVARRLGMTPEAVDEIARGAELHDVGKMAIPDAILDKPGSLDDGEWSFVRRHTVIGEAILSAAPALVPVARLVRSSHERYDGGGYPDGLAGESIPLGSRIIFACDAYDAMVTDRPYSAARTPDEALEQIRRGRGAEFDPSVVAALCDAVRAGDADGDRPAPVSADDLAGWSPSLPERARD
ncbi:MAG: diguanylate cyclase [Actinomycetota bacterium]|nr:diguanylate cyclase [Actinomycetota bacterium]